MTQPRAPIIDAQVHIWGADSPSRPWRPEGRAFAHRLDRPFLAPELLEAMDQAGVERAILVPPSWEGDRNDLVSEASARHPDRFGWLGRLDLSVPDPAAVKALRLTPGCLGARLTFSHGETRKWLLDGTADWVWPELVRCETPVMVFAPGQHQALERVAREHPGLRLTIDHVGIGTEVKDVPLAPFIDPIVALAELPNVAVKATALPCLVSEPFPFPSLRKPLRRLLDAYGPNRVFWGTDLTRLPCTYSEGRDFVEELDVLEPGQKALFFGQAIADWLDWP